MSSVWQSGYQNLKTVSVTPDNPKSMSMVWSHSKLSGYAEHAVKFSKASDDIGIVGWHECNGG